MLAKYRDLVSVSNKSFWYILFHILFILLSILYGIGDRIFVCPKRNAFCVTTSLFSRKMKPKNHFWLWFFLPLCHTLTSFFLSQACSCLNTLHSKMHDYHDHQACRGTTTMLLSVRDVTGPKMGVSYKSRLKLRFWLQSSLIPTPVAQKMLTPVRF